MERQADEPDRADFELLCSGSARLDQAERRFAVEQLVLVAVAGYRPSMDVFVLFDDGSNRAIPIDLDLVTEEASFEVRAKELLKLVIKLGANPAGTRPPPRGWRAGGAGAPSAPLRARAG